jgi:hypothetical protein
MAKHSINPGVTESTVQFETVRKMKSAFVTLYQGYADNASTAVIGGKEGGKQLVTGVPIYNGWYDRANTGMHHRMGDKVVQDYGLSRNAVIALQEIMEEELLNYSHSRNPPCAPARTHGQIQAPREPPN